MKRIIACILCVCLMLSGCSMLGGEEMAGEIVAELAEYTPEDRANMVAIALPMLLTDSGLDLAADLVINYNPESNSMYNELLHPVFKIIDQETALSMLAQMYKIDEALRSKYFEGFYYRKEAQLSAGARATVEKFFADEISQVAGLEQICREDGITPLVLAHFFGLFVELNGNTALLTDADGADFKPNTVKPLLDEIMLGMTQNEIDFTTGLSKLVIKLNGRYSALEKQQLKRAFREIGLYTPSGTNDGGGITGGGVTGGGTSDEPKPEALNGFAYKITEHSEENGDTLEVAYYKNGVRVPGKELTEPLKIAVPVNTPNVMLYYEGEDSTPVKYTAYADGMLYCRVEKVGTYKLYSVEPYFLDANGWGKDYIEALFRRSIISGKSAGVFAPEARITREEFVKLAVELFGLTDASLTCDFADVPASAWYAPYIASAKKHGIVNGISAEQFGVGAPITRQDMCKILYGMLVKMGLTKDISLATLQFNDAAEIAAYATEPVRALVSLGIIAGDDLGNFNPTNYATRQEAAKLIYGMLLLYVQ